MNKLYDKNNWFILIQFIKTNDENNNKCNKFYRVEVDKLIDKIQPLPLSFSTTIIYCINFIS